MSNKKALKAFTLLEILVVIIIIGILAALSLIAYTSIKEQTLEKDAKANLKLIRSAEMVYKMESSTNSYIACANTTAINTNLKLSLPTGTNRSWDYKVDSTVATSFTAKARRAVTPAPGTVWCITQAVEDPYTAGCAW